jgi:Rrf2 family cysteine metabolism transcriptional repressor
MMAVAASTPDTNSPQAAPPRIDASSAAHLHLIPTKSLGIEARTLATPTQPAVTHRPSFHGSGAVAFSTKGEYGVRLMVQLGRHYGAGPASLAEIAAEEDLPRAYLEQLVMSLRDAGLVLSTRGAHGGYELSREPSTIRMGEILRALEGPIAPMICATEDPEHATNCDRSARCTVNLLWVRVRDAITGALDGMTLADLVPPRVVHVEAAIGSPVAGQATAAIDNIESPLTGAMNPS